MREEGREAQYRRIWSRSPRMARALEASLPPEEDTLALVGSYVLAPALGSFVQWLLQEAVKSGIRRLYFLARDGYFPYRAALIFCEKRRLPMECRYLSCSRYSLRLPLFHLDREEALDYVCRGGIDVTMDKILSRAGLTEEEKREVFRRLSLSFLPEEVLPHAELPEIRRRLGACGAFLSYMDGLTGYLRQEGLLDDFPDAVVDSGWVGSVQKSLRDALARMGRTRPLAGYYWGLYELPSGVSREEYHTYYFAPEGDLGAKLRFNNCLFAAVYTAPHGMTLSYRREGERFVPRYGRIGEEKKAFVERLEEYLLSYIRRLADTEEKLPDADAVREDRRVVRDLLGRFMGRPSRKEAELFGSLPFSDDVLEGKERPIAAPLTGEELDAHRLLPKLALMAGLRKGSLRESAWHEGSVVRSGRRVRRRLRQYRLYQAARQLRKMLRFRKERGRKDERRTTA